MAMSAPFHPPVALQALTVFFVLLSVLLADAEGRHHVHDCPPFSCGRLRDVSFPFRRRGDPPGCGVPSYELVCTDDKVTILIGSGTYDVVSINYTGSMFWVVEANLGTQSNCLLPRWDYQDDINDRDINFALAPEANWATFVNCSHAIKSNGIYSPVACLSTNSSFIYVFTDPSYVSAGIFEPSCGYLAKTPSNGHVNASYADDVEFMRKGFALLFPFTRGNLDIRKCLADIEFRQEGIKYWTGVIIFIGEHFWFCVIRPLLVTSAVRYMDLAGTCMIVTYMITFAMWVLTLIHVLCRFVLAPLVIFTFLAHKYWKTRITIDSVEKFLRMQHMLGGPTRYAYTDIIAMTNHFRDKLGQGGYGSVYKGVLLPVPGCIHVAVKILGNSNCNGEDFISEVSTIGKIHHFNVVRLVGFCSEEMRRALVYEYMPCGSLDKYIFSSEKSFSWDKLNEIALGIARGISYLHQGCDLQILHFDIKPQNILLDHNFVPKVADFGLAKLFPRDTSFVPMSAMRGTIGYIAPEMVSRGFGVISSKSDVYSFGMLLLEMAGGRRNADPNVANSSQNYYPSWVYDRLIGEQVHEISSVVDMHELEKKLCIVGLWCIQMKSHDRPTMSQVTDMLESGVDGLAMPSRPFFCDDDEHIPDVGSYSLSSELNDIEEEEGE